MGEQGRSEEIRGGREIRRDRALQLARLEPQRRHVAEHTPPPVKTICFPVGFSGAPFWFAYFRTEHRLRTGLPHLELVY